MKYDELPWNDPSEWESDKWYPMLTGSLWINDANILYPEGYNIFKKDPEGPEGDIIPVVCGPFTFRVAVEICEAHNEEQLPGVPR